MDTKIDMKSTSNRFACIALLLLIGHITNAQQADHLQFIDAQTLGLAGKIPHDGPYYHRIDTASNPDLPANVKQFLTHAAGTYVRFQTNSTRVAAKWCTTSAKPYSNLTAIAFEGLDLYIKNDGKWQYAGVGRPSQKDCSEQVLVRNMDNNIKEYLLYLPLYDGVTHLEIGVDSDATIKSSAPISEKEILIYGTSITQGASASRPGLAYPSRLSRELGVNIINMGVSGSAKMEASVADLIASWDMDAFIIDCIPNCSVDNIVERTALFFSTIRAKHPGKPIIAIEGIVFESGNFDQLVAEDLRQRNIRFKQEIAKLQLDDPFLYYISSDGLLGDDHEGTIDGTHPNDLGFDRMTQKLKPVLENILKQHNIL